MHGHERDELGAPTIEETRLEVARRFPAGKAAFSEWA
jgi:hypothetical protein